MSDESGSGGKWLLGVLATVVSGVAIYYLTEGRRPDPPPVVSPNTFVSTPAPTVNLSTPTPEVVEITVTNALGPEQVSEDVQVYIEGRLVANLTVDQQSPKASTKVKVAGPGNYAYTLIADGYFVNQLGQTYRAQGRGDGVIEARQGSVFSLAITPHGLRMIPE
jgi:hypothetical protein